MTPELQSSGGHIALLVLGGLLLFGGLIALRWVLELVPMARARRDAIARATPVVGALVGVAYLLWVGKSLFHRHPDYEPFVLTVIVAGVVAASWFAVRDVITGVILKAGRVCQVGDQVRVEGVEGRIKRMGLRVLTIETNRGDEAIIPFSSIARESVLRTPVIDSVALHVFKLPVPPEVSVPDAKAVVREQALRSHWAALSREPEVQLVDDDTFEVTVYALDVDHGPEIEAAVRRTPTFDRRKEPRS